VGLAAVGVRARERQAAHVFYGLTTDALAAALFECGLGLRIGLAHVVLKAEQRLDHAVVLILLLLRVERDLAVLGTAGALGDRRRDHC